MKVWDPIDLIGRAGDQAITAQQAGFSWRQRAAYEESYTMILSKFRSLCSNNPRYATVGRGVPLDVSGASEFS